MAQPNELLNEEAPEMRLQRALYEDGLLSEIKPPRVPQTDAERAPLIEITGEPLSATIIKEDAKWMSIILTAAGWSKAYPRDWLDVCAKHPRCNRSGA